MVKRYIHLLGEHTAILGFGFAAVFWGNFGQSFFIGAFGEAIQQGLQLSASAYGNAYAFATVASALTVTWLGGLIDRFPLKTYALAVSLGLFVAMLLMSQVGQVATLMLALYLLRLFGQALLPHTGITTMARTFQSHRGIAVSIATSGVPAGEVILPWLAVTLIAAIGWQMTFLSLSFSVPLLLIPIMIFSLNRGFAREDYGADLRAAPAQAEQSAGARRALLSDYRFWLMLPGYMSGPFIVTGIFVHQNFIIANKAWGHELFATAFVLYGLVHWLSSLVSGAMVDRFKAVKLLPFYPLPMAAGLLVLAFVPGDLSAFVMMALLAISIGSSPPISNSLWPEIYGSKNLGAIRSLTIALMVLATAGSPILFGVLIDAGVSLEQLMGACALYVLLASLLMALSYTLRPQRHPMASP